MIDIKECPICKGTQFRAPISCIDFTVSHETFHVKQCNTCTLAITSPRPEDENLGRYYNSDEYISHSGKTSGGIGYAYKLARLFSLNWKKRLITNYKSSGALLDFGCGTGEFLHEIQKQGWEVFGVEPSTHAREKATTLTGISLGKDLSEINNKQFDVITAWHVLEHVPDPNETISKLKKSLKEDGVILIAVPNYESADSLHYQNYWAGYDVPRHLWHFSKKSMIQLLHNQGFKLIELKPMKLDSYYISLLSEKYKNDNKPSLLGYIKAFANGFISNLKARSQNNHSSLIYIARIHED